MLRIYPIKNILLVIGISFLYQLSAHATEGIRFYIEKDLAALRLNQTDFEKKKSELNRLLILSLENFNQHDTTTSKIYESLAQTYTVKRLFDEALEYKFNALEILEHFKDAPALAKAYTEIGQLYNNLSEHDKSEEYLLKGLESKKELFDHSYFENYYGLCQAYHEQGKFNLQKKYAGYALEIAKNPKEIIDAKYLFILAHARLKELDQGYALCDEVVKMAEDNGLKFRLGRAYTNIAWLKTIELDYLSSARFYKKGIELIEASDEDTKNHVLSFNYSTLSNIYRRISAQSKSKSDISLSFLYANKAIEKSKIFYGRDYVPDMGRRMWQQLFRKNNSTRSQRNGECWCP